MAQLMPPSSLDAIINRRRTPEDRLRKYKPGSIYRVRLKDFLTYADVEFSPGPRLNVVIGPNGTGKSTLLCAICLGLGGEPPLLGRADDARTFIMHEKDLAVIEIELAPHWDSNDGTARQGHVIRRIIDRNKGTERGRGKGASSYFINGESTTKKEVTRLVQETYHIAIDNLCTFLPQDRVGSFSGFDSKMLLQETEKSLSPSKHLFTTHQQLIELEREILTSGSSVDTIEDKLKSLEAENEQLEREKELMEERKQALAQMELLEQKKAWLAFDVKRTEAHELKLLKTEAKKDLEAARNCCAPLQDALGEISTQVDRMKSRRTTLEKDMQRASKEHDKCLRKSEKFSDSIEEEIINLNAIDSMQRKAERDAERQRAKVEEIAASLSDYPPMEDIEQDLASINVEMRELRRNLTLSKKAAADVTNELKELKHRAAQSEKKLAKMNDEKAQRKARIFRQQPNLEKTYEWVDQNKKMFRRPVWGPIVCEITDVKNANVAAYLEQHVPNAILKSYVVECEEDYNLLYREVRTKRNMAINIVRVESIDPTRRIHSNEKMAMLRKDHGIVCYLDEAVSAPEKVMQALRNTAQIDQVLVGGTKTQESMDRRGLMDILTTRDDGSKRSACVFTCHHNRSYKYTSQISRYGSGKSFMRVDEINPARMLAKGSDPEAKASLERDIAELNDQIKGLEPRQQEEGQRYEELQREGQGISQRLNAAKDSKAALKKLQNKLEVGRNKLRDLEDDVSKDSGAEKDAILSKLKKHVANSIKANEDAATQYAALMKNTHTLAGIKMTEDGFSEKHRKLQEALYEKEAESAALEDRLEQAIRDFKHAKSVLADLKKRAEQIAPMTEELKATLDTLPPTLEEVEALLEEAMQKANSITDNPEVLRRYEERKREIEETRSELENLNEASDAKRTQLDSMRTPWEAALENMVKGKVNALFEKYMSELGCAGEVHLKKGQGDGKGDFENWGVEIKVKFREKSALQVLSAQTHSGGERSVSTIMYLMALQDMMVSPFRCVDEINQGLDERNERLVFRRIVENSTKAPKKGAVPNSHCGQYFLITPKLLPNLTDMENEDVTILCIFNGHHNFKSFKDWNVDTFLESRKRFIAENGSDDDEEDEDGEYARSKELVGEDVDGKENAENALAEGEEEEKEEEEVSRTRRGGGGRKKRKVEM